MLHTKNKLFALLLFLAFAGTVVAQKGTKSPYSSYGLGELSNGGYASFASMGGIAMGATQAAIVNSNNPASYVYLDRHIPVFQLGMNGRFSQFSIADESTGSTNQSTFGLNQFQLGLPIKKNWGAAIGIKPYSFTGYEITRYTVTDGDTSELFVNEGSGGIRIANFGLAYRPLNKSEMHTIEIRVSDTTDVKKYEPIIGNRINRLSLGVNVQYLFGSTDQTRSLEFIPLSTSIFNARVEEGLRLSGVSWEAGVNYQFGFESVRLKRILSVGATYSPATEVRGFQDLFSYSYIGTFYQGATSSILDTIELVRDNKGVVLKPESYKIGFEYRISPKGIGSQLRVGADLNFERWSSFYTRFSGVETSGDLKDRLSLGVGLEYAPVYAVSSRGESPFFGKLRYRVGFNYTQTELSIENSLGTKTDINNYGMSFGLGLPVRVNNSNTNINFGASLGNMGTTDNGLIQDRYIGVYFGLSITPGAGNYWFVKRKYD